MEETAIDREAMGRLAKALAFVCGADHPTTIALGAAARLLPRARQLPRVCLQKVEGVLCLLQRESDDRRRQRRGRVGEQFLDTTDVGLEDVRRILDEVADFR